ncbi:hypothetical protein GCM10009760_58210 [Kitasatospora kazusensis]|uniref:Uncharacterized protein n=1 Tax=Kitasatospora kazusensis TaxID=407974 RepID=A0ABN3A9H2_9ACTN
MPQQREQAGPGDAPEGRRRIDLSVAQVAASALATVVGALFASGLGVYGTIVGAAVVSVGATTGGALFQHLFRRTGEQLRGAVDRSPAALANDFRQVGAESISEQPYEISSEWNESRTLRSKRPRTWRTYTAVSALVFVLAMTPIIGFELATGQPVSATVKGESGSGTSLGGSSDSRPSPPRRTENPPASGDTAPSGTPSRTPGATPSGRASESPSPTPSSTPSGTGTPSGTPSSTPSRTPGGTPSGTPGGTPTGTADTAPPAAPSGTPSP